tara:strand:+ start:1008 stop:1568 length:561 start_codon:yes stop_codon:yes gene_type:complete
MKNKINNSIWSIEHSNNLVKEHSKKSNTETNKNFSNKANYFDKYPSVTKEVVNDLKQDGYTSLFDNFIDNIFVFYKIINKKLYITVLEGVPVHIKNKTPFRTINYFFNIQNLTISSSVSNKGISFQDTKHTTIIDCFHSHDYFNEKRNLTTIELETLNKYKESFFQKVYSLNKNLIKKQKQKQFTL